MARTIEEAREVIRGLSMEDKEVLTGELVHELNKADSAIEQEWLKESDKRWMELDSGAVEPVPLHVARNEINKIINE